MIHRGAIGVLALAASIASATAGHLWHFDAPDLPQTLYQQFRDQVIIAGKCQAYQDVTAPLREAPRSQWPVHWTAEMLAEANKALNACFLDWQASRS